MTESAASDPSRWRDATAAAALFAVDPKGTAGVSLRSQAGPLRDLWLGQLRGLLPAETPWRRVPIHVSDDRLLGGLNLAATLRAGRPVAEPGLLAEADGGVVLLTMAERLLPMTVARLGAVLDSEQVAVQRDGLASRSRTRLGVIALDEGLTPEESTPRALLDRLAFLVDLEGIRIAEATASEYDRDAVLQARLRLPDVALGQEVPEALCATALALGIGSLRAPLLALRVARATAALEGRREVSEADAASAARLVLAPRASCLPASEVPPEQDSGETETPQDETPQDELPQDGSPQDGAPQDEAPAAEERPLEDVVLAAAAAAIPEHLLARLSAAAGGKAPSLHAGRSGALRQGFGRGRPVGLRRGLPRGGQRLNVIETLRAAAPWQKLRREDLGDTRRARVQVRRDDLRITRSKQHDETATIFVVDASGSSALHRLGEAKGAVELLLADCYVRRDQVALIAFRGKAAELLLPPTRSLVRAKRCLACLPGGGGTPLALGLDAALVLAEAVTSKGQAPTVVLLTDGRANVARDGTPGRPRAEEEAKGAARRLRAAGVASVLVDTSPQPRPTAREVAAEMAALYLPLPQADAKAISRAVLHGTAASPGRRAASGP